MIKLFAFPRYLIRQYSLRTEIEQLIVTFIFFSSFLLGVRIFYTGTITFITLEWNLFLAFIPYFITQWLGKRPSLLRNKWKFVSIFFTWLVFIPNSFYILTDLFHLQENNNAPLWFDLMLILSFAWNGLLAGILSVRQMEKITQVLWKNKHELLFLYPVMLLNALGIYIGRYLRYNSWDIITNPFDLVMDIFDMMFHPLNYINEWSMIFFYSIFILLMYQTVKRVSKFVN